MDGSHFDDLTRRLAIDTDRRRLVRGLVAGLGAVFGLAALDRSEAKPADKPGGGGNPTGRCPTGFTNCRGTCVDLSDHPNHCGVCNLQCSPGETCCAGTCTPIASFQSDPTNCGACGNACATDAVCCTGVCRTATSFQDDEANCGSCGHVCVPSNEASGTICIEGTCLDCVRTAGARCGLFGGPCCSGLVCVRSDLVGLDRCQPI
jgi:hypothetical protein